MMEELPRPPSLRHNGALDPNAWQPTRDNLCEWYGSARPEVGDLIAWRYAAWRVHDIRPYLDVDLTDEQQEKLARSAAHLTGERRAKALLRHRPFHLILRHESGPLIIQAGEARGFRRLHDGTREISFTSWPHTTTWARLTEPYRTCSCHGHIWPCQEIDRNAVAQHQTQAMNKLMATAEPGVCAHCLEAITTRQRTLTFPEPSRLVPGAPGPTFHAGRSECWSAAEKYERTGRLADNPDIARLASCPGIRFIHEKHGMPADQRVECTAGPLCTGKHGPSGYDRPAACWYRDQIAEADGFYTRPALDCGYRGGHGACLGGDLSSGGSSISPIAADLLWENRKRRGGL